MAKRRRKNRKWIIGGVIFVMSIVLGVVGFLVWNSGQGDGGGNDVSTEETKKETVEVVKNTNDTTGDEKSEDEMEEEMMRDKNVVRYEGDNPNKAESLSGVITYAGVNGGKLMIRVNIDQYLSSGKCDLALIKNGGTVYNSTTNIVASASTATCEGFDVPVDRIGSGNVEININLSADGRSGLIRGEASI